MGHISLDKELEVNTFEWPTPPYFKVSKEADKSTVESCIVDLIGKPTLTGMLVRFSPQEQRVLLKPFTHEKNQVIPFNEIKSLQLLSTTEVISESHFLETRAEEMHHPSEKQAYHIEFIDDSTVSGETMGYINDEAGLYLFPVMENAQIEKHFIPRHAIQDYQIGMQIGDILVEGNHASDEDIALALEQQKELRSKRIGDYLNENEIISTEQLRQAINHQKKRPVLKLGEALMELNLLSSTQLAEALETQKDNRNLRLGEILIDMGIVNESTLNATLAQKLGIPYVNLTNFNFDPNAIRLIDKALAKKFIMIPLCMHEAKLVVALEDPMNFKAIDELRFVTQMNVLPAMAPKEQILASINDYYQASNSDWNPDEVDDVINDDGSLEFDIDTSSSGDDLANKLFEEDESRIKEVENEPILESDNTLVQLVNKMILDASNDRVSDIHIETYPDKNNTVVRFRKDGSLHHYLEIPANFSNAIISRIKIMAHLDISERRKPQDGKIDFQQYGPKKLELRVATIPTANGLEDVVMRLLASSKPVPLDKLGLSQEHLAVMQSLVATPYGLILVCGPTGSGKTTSLHSLLGHINKPDRKIWTAEDPVEITQKGLRQVQVNPKIGWSFAQAMRSFLRADPDVIMVGEMRDEETTRIGIEASLTGHLVLSTLHTNSAPESITRMLDLGMDPFNFADALLGILAQRLTKCLCSQCKEAYTPSEEELNALAEEYVFGTQLDIAAVLAEWQASYNQDNKLKLYKAKGCQSCNDSGYKGRAGLYELMKVTPSIKHLIQTKSTVSKINDEAIANGMRTLKQDGIHKILEGQTDIAQVRAVCT